MITKPIKLSKNITIGPAPSGEKELEKLASKGFKLIVNLQKDREFGMGPSEEEELTKEFGMNYLHHPISISSIKRDHVDTFIDEIDEKDFPVYIHCRIGQRAVPLSLILHAIRRKLSVEKIFKKADKVGIEFSSPFLRNFIESYMKGYERREAEAA